jgi:Probable zinc-ribbon domain
MLEIRVVKWGMGKRKAKEKTTSRPASGRGSKLAQPRLEDQRCSCCRLMRPMRPSTAPWRIESLSNAQKPGIWGTLEPGWSAKYASHLAWACDDCLEAGRALAAKPWLQTYQYGFALFAYFDETRTCDDCQTEFVFSASEQAFWYESLQFTAYSVPKQCPDCRKTRRKAKGVHLELGRIHAQFAGTVPELIQLADLYLELGNAPKALEHLRRAKNKTRSVELLDQLLVRIAVLEAARAS